MRMGIQAIEGSTWDIFFGTLRGPIFVSLEDGRDFRVNGKWGKSIIASSKFVSCEFFEIPNEDELEFRAGIKRWIASVERANGRADWIRFTPGTMTVKVEIFKGN